MYQELGLRQGTRQIKHLLAYGASIQVKGEKPQGADKTYIVSGKCYGEIEHWKGGWAGKETES